MVTSEGVNEKEMKVANLFTSIIYFLVIVYVGELNWLDNFFVLFQTLGEKK